MQGRVGAKQGPFSLGCSSDALVGIVIKLPDDGRFAGRSLGQMVAPIIVAPKASLGGAAPIWRCP